MYNSRPRYTRYDNYPQTVKVPKNYSGNAFGDSFLRENTELQDLKAQIADEEEQPQVRQEKILPKKKLAEQTDSQISTTEDKQNDTESEECSASPKKKSLFGNVGFGRDLGKLFGGFGFEELLILGLIFLMMQNEGNEDIILLLILLFFVN